MNGLHFGLGRLASSQPTCLDHRFVTLSFQFRGKAIGVESLWFPSSPQPHLVLWSECLCPPRVHMLGFWTWPPWRWWCWDVGSLGGNEVMRVKPSWIGLVNTLIKNALERFLAPSAMWKYNMKSVIWKRALTWQCWHLVLDSGTVRDKFLFFISYPVFGTLL